MTPSAAVILAMLPLGVFGMVAIVPPQSVPAGRNDRPFVPTIAVRTEGITARRMDETTFRRRWPVDIPPMIEMRERSIDAGTAHGRHSVVTPAGSRPASLPAPVPVVVAAAATPAPRPVVRIVKRASLRLDICARHGLRRIEYLKRGYKAWRCQRR